MHGPKHLGLAAAAQPLHDPVFADEIRNPCLAGGFLRCGRLRIPRPRRRFRKRATCQQLFQGRLASHASFHVRLDLQEFCSPQFFIQKLLQLDGIGTFHDGSFSSRRAPSARSFFFTRLIAMHTAA